MEIWVIKFHKTKKTIKNFFMEFWVINLFGGIQITPRRISNEMTNSKKTQNETACGISKPHRWIL